MSQEFNDCVKRGKVKIFTPGKNIAPKEIRLAKDDLATAKLSISGENYKWAIVQIYYSMFHAARALLYQKDYREKSHYCLIEAIRSLYVETGVLKSSFLEALVEAKNLRENADYYGDFSSINAKKLFKKADEFIKIVEKIISKL